MPGVIVVVLMLAFLLTAKPIKAETGFLDFQHEIPELMINSDSSGTLSSWHLEEHIIFHFDGFSPGGSADLPFSDQERFINILGRLKPNQYVFVQGLADNERWRDRASKEYDRLDLTLAWTRSQWAVETAQKYMPETEGRVRILMPSLERAGRGFNVHVAAYAPVVSGHAAETEKSWPRETLSWPNLSKGKETVSQENWREGGLRIGGGTGFRFVSAEGMNFSAPTLGLVLKRESIKVSLWGGLRPAGSRKDGLGGRTDALAGVEASWRREHVGLAAGLEGAWKTLNRSDEFLERAFGLYAGPQLFIGSEYDNFGFAAGVNGQILNLNKFGRTDPWWSPGWGLSAELQYVLD